jgi:hypothetical protein
MRALFSAALRNRIAALGVAVTTASGVIFLFLIGFELLGLLRSPYAGILIFVLVPALFVLGLLLIPIGVWRERRRSRAVGPSWPRLDLSASDMRRALVFVSVATLVNVAILSFASYGAVKYSGSQQFCGESCHVMTPQFVAHQNGPHGRVQCVACHIEPGAQGFLRAKLNGTRQLALVATGRYATPIPSPPTSGIPNVHTSCEQCHWPDRFIGDVIKVVHEFADDEKNTETKTTLRLHVGGPISGTGNGVGIHWHMNRANQVEYIALDPALQQIPYVSVSTSDGQTREYFAEGTSDADLAGKPRRQMVCIDCHNRPAHQFGSTPERSVDAALGAGLISPQLPFVRREAVQALKTAYPSQDAALIEIERAMRAALQPRLDDKSADAMRQAIAVTQGIYRTNIFPAMKVGWGTYNNQIGHMTTAGCFRCHDDSHKTKDGRVLGQDCESCHTIE